MKSKNDRRGRGARGLIPTFTADQRKTRQLCRQVHQRIDLVLAGELDDRRFEGLWVLEVEPEAGSSALLVTLIAPEGGDPVALAAALDSIKGLLRREVAAAIHRKRTPHLRFAVLPHQGWVEAEPEVDHD